VDDLLLLAVAAGDSFNGMRLFQWSLGHDRPPTDMLTVGRSSVNRIAVNLTVEKPTRNEKREPDDIVLRI
jgi:hypothetical protein